MANLLEKMINEAIEATKSVFLVIKEKKGRSFQAGRLQALCRCGQQDDCHRGPMQGSHRPPCSIG